MNFSRDSEDAAQCQVSFQLSHSCHIVSFSGDFNYRDIQSLISHIVNTCYAAKAELGVIFDFSAIDFLDRECFLECQKLAKMIKVMGQNTVLSGLKPGIISTLVDLEVDTQGIHTACNLEDAYRVLGSFS